MTRRPPGAPGPGAGAGDDGAADGGFASAQAVAGLARELDGLRRAHAPLVGLPVRVDDLARTVAQLADAVCAMPPRPGPTIAPSWLAAPTDTTTTTAVLQDLVGWLRVVFLRYPDGAAVLPECWLWHPDAVEELLWLRHAWTAAYEAKTASVQLAGDWHDRQRPGVVRRLRATVGSCSRERHQTRPGWTSTPTGPVTVPGLDALDTIAAWWAAARDQPAPEPAGDAHRRGGGLRDALDGTNGSGRLR